MNRILELKKVNRHYKDKNRNLEIIKDLDWQVNEGDFVAVLGKSGSGKSTFLNLIGMLDEPSSGNIMINNKEVSKLNQDERDRMRNEFLGFIFQFHFLLPEFTALENVIMPALVNKKVNKKEVEERAKELLKEVGLEDRIDHKPSELSGGEKQRVAIARALINSPKILLADEPTGNLDEETSEVIHNILRRINEKHNQTIIVVTHSQELASICRERVYLKKGKLES